MATGNEYEVERILADDVVDGQTFYLVKWNGYPDEECTWEPVESFTSEDSIKRWEKEKDSGLGLPDEFLVTLQQRMDAFQARQQGGRSPSPSAGSDSSNSDDIELAFRKPTMKQSMPSASNSATLKSRVLQRDEPPRRKVTAVILKGSEPRNIASTLQPPKRSTATKPAATFAKPLVHKSDAAKAPKSKAGEKFRNLKHMNNARKKGRTEPAPNIPTSQLRSAADFKTGPDTAHILPSRVVESNRAFDSPLFVPETNPNNNVTPSPTPSDGSVFPPTKAAHELTQSDTSGNELMLRIQRNTDNSCHVETTRLPERSLLITAKNGRRWYKGDVVCGFTMGRIIGSARVIHLSPAYASYLITVKRREHSDLTIDFESKPLLRPDLEKLFYDFDTSVQALGLVDPFEDQQRYFEEFAQWLESNDFAAVFHHPTADISLILYSCDARSWKDFGKLQARPGSYRARLHVAFLPKLIPRQAGPRQSITENEPLQSTRPAKMPLSGKPADIRIPPVEHKGVEPLSGQSSAVPSIARGVSGLIISSEGPFNSPADEMNSSVGIETSPLNLSPFSGGSRSASPAVSTPMSPSKSLFVGADGLPRKASSSDAASGAAVERNTVQPYRSGRSARLDFDSLIQAHRTLKLDRSDPHFFLSFSGSHPKEAQMMQDWIERYTAASNVYLESERHGWTRFCDQIEKHRSASVVLLHGDDPNFQQLPRLGSVLTLLKLSVFSLTFNGINLAEPSPASTTVKKLFPHGAMYLMTESAIVHHPNHALKALQYFDKNKGANYRMMMRPNVERWILSQAAEEPHEGRMHTLLDIVVLIRNLGVAPAGPMSTENGNSITQASFSFNAVDESTKYIITPDGMPGYPDAESSTTSSNMDNRTASSKPLLTLEQRDNLLQTYFFYYTAARAHKFRRFPVIISSATYATIKQELQKKTDDNKLDCGHVAFLDIKSFVNRNYGEGERQANATTK